jgi:hypothetical protein
LIASYLKIAALHYSLSYESQCHFNFNCTPYFEQFPDWAGLPAFSVIQDDSAVVKGKGVRKSFSVLINQTPLVNINQIQWEKDLNFPLYI